MRSTVNIFSSIALAIALAACATSTSRGPGQMVDDAALTARVKTAIATTAGVKDAAQINVDTYRGVVSLAGFVDSAQEATRAADVAARVSGVESVRNNLEVKPR